MGQRLRITFLSLIYFATTVSSFLVPKTKMGGRSSNSSSSISSSRNLYENLNKNNDNKNNGKDGDNEIRRQSTKRIVFIRHGRTYMNDFINGINYGTPNFTDIFPDTPEYKYKYYDSPLSPTGLEQARELNRMLSDLKNGDDEGGKKKKENAARELSLSKEEISFLDELDLVVVSPLTRALQTMEIGLYDNIQKNNNNNNNRVPIMAVPLATERVYLVSDIGKSRKELKKNYDYVDFDTAFSGSNNKKDNEDKDDGDEWYFTPTEHDKQTYVEWRPNGEGQKYACLGEPQHYFDKRMSDLYRFLDSRAECTIAVVCHAGVIDWFTREIFENCEVRIIPFEELNPRNLVEKTLSL